MNNGSWWTAPKTAAKEWSWAPQYVDVVFNDGERRAVLHLASRSVTVDLALLGL